MLLDFPKNPRENLIWRREILTRAKHDIEFRMKVKELFHRDILFAFNAFFFTLDVRKRPFHNIPFCTWPYQDEVILGLAESIRLGRDEVWEKSRDMGASWMILLVFLWFWLDSKGGGDFLVGSRIEDYVDKKGDMRTLIQKARYAVYKLPPWLRPKGFSPKKHDNHMKLENPETGSTIIGESNNANFSTGGRFLAILYDEFAKWESTDESAWTAGGDASPSRIANSTPFGVGGQYYKLVTDGKTLKRTLHWSLHPEKAEGISCRWPSPNEDSKEVAGEGWKPRVVLTSPWYEKEILRRSKREIRQELDISYEGSGNPVFDDEMGETIQYFLSIPDKPKFFGRPRLTSLSLEIGPPQEDQENFLVIYEPFEKGRFYAIGVDVVEGLENGDFAVISVLDRATKNIAGVYWSRIDEVGLARVVKIVQDYYSISPSHHTAPWVGIETNGPGLAAFDFADTLGVVNLFMAYRYEVSSSGISYKKGWRTDSASRPELVAGLKEYFRYRIGTIYNHRLLGECLSFVYSKTGKPQAKSGTHDDMVMSFGIAYQVDILAPRPDEKSLVEIKEIQGRNDLLFPQEGFSKIDEPKTFHEKCLFQALEMQKLREENKEGFEQFMRDIYD